MKVETCRNPRNSGEVRAYLILQTIEACIARTPQTVTSEFATSEIGLRPSPTFASLGCGSPTAGQIQIKFLIVVSYLRSSAAGIVLFFFGFQNINSPRTDA